MTAVFTEVYFNYNSDISVPVLFHDVILTAVQCFIE
jgi:hypothetical protein